MQRDLQLFLPQSEERRQLLGGGGTLRPDLPYIWPVSTDVRHVALVSHVSWQRLLTSAQLGPSGRPGKGTLFLPSSRVSYLKLQLCFCCIGSTRTQIVLPNSAESPALAANTLGHSSQITFDHIHIDMISVPQVKPFRPSPRSHSQLLTRDLSSQIPALNRLWNTLLAPRLLVLCVKIVWWKQLGVVWCKGPYVIYRWEQPPLWWPYTFITPFLFASGLCHS